MSVVSEQRVAIGQPVDRVDDVHVVAVDYDGAFLAARERGNFAMIADALKGGVERQAGRMPDPAVRARRVEVDVRALIGGHQRLAQETGAVVVQVMLGAVLAVGRAGAADEAGEHLVLEPGRDPGTVVRDLENGAAVLAAGAITLGIGLLISSAVKSQFVASQITLLVSFLPAVMLSGFLFDLRSMPDLVRLVTYVLPARYYVALLQTVFLAGDVWAVIIPNAAVLAVMAATLVILTRRVTRKSLA
jgi:hypothetical protein